MTKWCLSLECMVSSTFKNLLTYFTTGYREITGPHPATFVLIEIIGEDIWSTNLT